jgi:signal transduction histidine kinase
MNGQRILVVEDDKSLRAGLHDTLEDEGFAVQTAANGVEGLQMMEKRCPDLIVADIVMPQMDGYDFYAAVRARPNWVSIPFIFLTARAEKSDILRGKDLGAEDYIIKPFDPLELVTAIRARLRRARAIRQVAEAEFDQLKQHIITALGHELRTPLTAVLGYADLALEDASSLSPEALHEYLGAIKQGADRLVRLAENFMILVRLDSGRAGKEFDLLAQVRHDLREIVERAARQYESQATDRGVTLESKVESDLPPVRLCKPFFVNALERLVDNGIKFSRGDRKRVTISARTEGDWVEIAVTDEGAGIPPDEIPHLFERFRQIGRERTEQQGTGLGLAIARELIRLHGGDIAVESQPNVGSTFTIRLPALKEE